MLESKQHLQWTSLQYLQVPVHDCTCSDFVATSNPFSDQTSTIYTHFQTWPLGRNYIIITMTQTKQFFNPFRICIVLFLSYSFGIETINTFIHFHSSLENHTRPEQNRQSVYLFSDQNGSKTLTDEAAHTYTAYIKQFPPPPPLGDMSQKALTNQLIKRPVDMTTSIALSTKVQK